MKAMKNTLDWSLKQSERLKYWWALDKDLNLIQRCMRCIDRLMFWLLGNKIDVDLPRLNGYETSGYVRHVEMNMLHTSLTHLLKGNSAVRVALFFMVIFEFLNLVGCGAK